MIKNTIKTIMTVLLLMFFSITVMAEETGYVSFVGYAEAREIGDDIYVYFLKDDTELCKCVIAYDEQLGYHYDILSLPVGKLEFVSGGYAGGADEGMEITFIPSEITLETNQNQLVYITLGDFSKISDTLADYLTQQDVSLEGFTVVEVKSPYEYLQEEIEEGLNIYYEAATAETGEKEEPSDNDAEKTMSGEEKNVSYGITNVIDYLDERINGEKEKSDNHALSFILIILGIIFIMGVGFLTVYIIRKEDLR